MSKKNRNRFRIREHDAQISPAQSPVPAQVRANGYDAGSHHADEYKVIRTDLIRLIALNGFVLAAVVILYYTNRTSGYLERLFERIF